MNLRRNASDTSSKVRSAAMIRNARSTAPSSSALRAESSTAGEPRPSPECPSITEHYKGLIGLSVSRGFTHKVRELFGGPRGCTHTTALLLAMGPAVVQSTFSMRVLAARGQGQGSGEGFSGFADMPIEERRKFWAFNLNTCHVWAEDGQFVADLEAGRGGHHVPVFVKKRLERLGRDGESWRTPMQG